jgi:hypothetical protein
MGRAFELIEPRSALQAQKSIVGSAQKGSVRGWKHEERQEQFAVDQMFGTGGSQELQRAGATPRTDESRVPCACSRKPWR